MDTTLVTVTLLSMGMAGALSVIVWRLLREERQRSDARVAALTALAGGPERAPRVDGARSEQTPRVERAGFEPTARVETPAPQIAVHPQVHRDRAAIDLDLPIRPAPSVSRAVEGADMFVDRPQESPWRNRLVVMTALGLVIASVVLFGLASSVRTAARARALHAPGVSAQNTPAVAPAQAGLELTSLRDSRRPGDLTITGLVRNPSGGAVLTRVTVIAFAFDDKGAFLSSGRALIDVTSLAPGDESPFEVSVPVADTVARYRIGFRSEDGRVIAHVDKRQQGPVAVLRLSSGQALRLGSVSGQPNW